MDHKNFLRILDGENAEFTLFEPFPTRQIVTQLIWRGGDELWDRPIRRAETLIEFYKYINSDVAVIEPSGAYEMLSAELPEDMRFVVISDDVEEIEVVSRNDKVCAVATRGGFVKTNRPMIYLPSVDSDQEDISNIDSRFSAVYLKKCTAAPKRVTLGGVGTDLINSNLPLRIYERVEELGCQGIRAVGSGGLGERLEYLGFISMLGKYNKMRNK